MIYRVALKDEEGHKGYSYTRTKKEAEAVSREWEKLTGKRADIEPWNTPVDKDDVVHILNMWGGHPDNG